MFPINLASKASLIEKAARQLGRGYRRNGGRTDTQ